MVVYKPRKGLGLYHIVGTLTLYNVILILAIIFVRSYVLTSLLKISLLILNVYQLRYLVLQLSLKYALDDENIYILSLLRKYKISYAEIESYKLIDEKINGIKLTGFGTSYFALGKSVIKNIGTTNMFVTSNRGVIYLKLKDMNYAISPEMLLNFKEVLENNNIHQANWESKINKEVGLHKDKNFMISLISVSIIISILTLTPFVLYLFNKLPGKMPLNFDSTFIPVEYGTGKQFAFNQMIYGVLNMAILFCMYYASHFYAKYDKKSANRFIHFSLVIAAAFLFIQIRILITFR